MDSKTKRAILDGLERWLARHPAPDQPAIGLGSGGAPGISREFDTALTPANIVDALHTPSPHGDFILRMFDLAIERHSLDEVLASFNAEEHEQRTQASAN